ncbi:MAG: hypothetical protein Q8O56_03525 [Solirubrobacteraceae bacterium]|nr:hypothetical protein [Solirubrobacteraceae bacterium]
MGAALLMLACAGIAALCARREWSRLADPRTVMPADRLRVRSNVAGALVYAVMFFGGGSLLVLATVGVHTVAVATVVRVVFLVTAGAFVVLRVWAWVVAQLAQREAAQRNAFLGLPRKRRLWWAGAVAGAVVIVTLLTLIVWLLVWISMHPGQVPSASGDSSPAGFEILVGGILLAIAGYVVQRLRRRNCDREHAAAVAAHARDDVLVDALAVVLPARPELCGLSHEVWDARLRTARLWRRALLWPLRWGTTAGVLVQAPDWLPRAIVIDQNPWRRCYWAADLADRSTDLLGVAVAPPASARPSAARRLHYAAGGRAFAPAASGLLFSGVAVLSIARIDLTSGTAIAIAIAIGAVMAAIPWGGCRVRPADALSPDDLELLSRLTRLGGHDAVVAHQKLWGSLRVVIPRGRT